MQYLKKRFNSSINEAMLVVIAIVAAHSPDVRNSWSISSDKRRIWPGSKMCLCAEHDRLAFVTTIISTPSTRVCIRLLLICPDRLDSEWLMTCCARVPCSRARHVVRTIVSADVGNRWISETCLRWSVPRITIIAATDVWSIVGCWAVGIAIFAQCAARFDTTWASTVTWTGCVTRQIQIPWFVIIATALVRIAFQRIGVISLGWEIIQTLLDVGSSAIPLVVWTPGTRKRSDPIQLVLYKRI